MIASSWKIESGWKVEPEKGWDDYEGDELPIVPRNPNHLGCDCGSAEFHRHYKVWECEVVDEDGNNIDYLDGDSCDDPSYYTCAECDAEVIWRD